MLPGSVRMRCERKTRRPWICLCRWQKKSLVNDPMVVTPFSISWTMFRILLTAIYV